jgi:hypothetical protein
LLLSRKSFVSTTALAVSGAALATSATAVAAENETASGSERTPVHFHILKASEYDHKLMMQTIVGGKKNKQVFQASNTTTVAPGIASVYMHMQNSMNAYEFSYGMGPGSLSTLAVLMGPGVVFALNDAMWSKYKFGAAFNLAPTNIYYTATSNLDLSASPDDPNGIYQDWSAQAVMKRGGAFMVCHNAMTAGAGMIASKAGLDPKTVLADFSANVLPHFQVVPAGVAAVQTAVEHGWGLFTIG